MSELEPPESGAPSPAHRPRLAWIVWALGVCGFGFNREQTPDIGLATFVCAVMVSAHFLRPRVLLRSGLPPLDWPNRARILGTAVLAAVCVQVLGGIVLGTFLTDKPVVSRGMVIWASGDWAIWAALFSRGARQRKEAGLAPEPSMPQRNWLPWAYVLSFTTLAPVLHIAESRSAFLLSLMMLVGHFLVPEPALAHAGQQRWRTGPVTVRTFTLAFGAPFLLLLVTESVQRSIVHELQLPADRLRDGVVWLMRWDIAFRVQRWLAHREELLARGGHA